MIVHASEYLELLFAGSETPDAQLFSLRLREGDEGERDFLMLALYHMTIDRNIKTWEVTIAGR